jgi:hypothetical protein
MMFEQDMTKTLGLQHRGYQERIYIPLALGALHSRQSANGLFPLSWSRLQDRIQGPIELPRLQMYPKYGANQD